MLILPIKREWFAMIISGEKKEEYREIKPYWTKRFQSYGLLDENGKVVPYTHRIIKLQNGYGKHSPYVCVDVRLFIRKGNEKWGAEKDKKYYVLRIKHRGSAWNLTSDLLFKEKREWHRI